MTTDLLNQSQMRALADRLFNHGGRPGGIWGPPGTGKTFTAAHEAVLAVMELRQRVLVAAFQNSTVDTTLSYIIWLLSNQFHMSPDEIRRMVKRTGTASKVAPSLLPHYTVSNEQLGTARIVGVTLHSSYVKTGHRMLEPSSFDRIIMDESGQITPEQAWIPMRLLNASTKASVTAYGDDVQLTPISADFVPERGVLRYLRLGNSAVVDMLDTTLRLNWPGVRMTSDIFYQGRLDAPEEVKARRLQLPKSPLGPYRKVVESENSLVYVGVKGVEIEDAMSYDNHAQAMAIADICSELTSSGVNPANISVMAPYRPHARTINLVLEDTGIRCTTVHRMLGGENDVVIFATTRSNNSHGLGFIKQPEFLNVATSRQRRKLVIVGDSRDTFAEGSNASRKIYDFIQSRGTMIIQA